MEKKLSASAQKVQDALREKGSTCVVIEHEKTTRSARDAAEAVGCSVAQIAKSLIFRLRSSGQGVLIITSGANRVNEARVGEQLNDGLEKADAEFVEAATGYAIGGVPPLAHRAPFETLIDEDLLKFDEIWAAAGTPNAVFKISPEELLRLTGGRLVRVK